MSETGQVMMRSVDVVADWVTALGQVDDHLDDVQRVDLLRQLEELKAAAAAAQARIAVAFDGSQRAAQAAAGVPARRQGAGVAGQVALARRDKPGHGCATPRSRSCSGARDAAHHGGVAAGPDQ